MGMKLYQHRFDQIEDYLHHRPPYLLVENIVSIETNEVVTTKTVSAKDDCLAGHFPGAPIFPGAMMQELVTQSAGVLIAANYNPMEQYNTSDPHFNKYALGVLVRVDSARYRGFARPGDQLNVRVQLNELVGSLFDFSGKIRLDNEEIMRIRFQLSNIESRLLTEA